MSSKASFSTAARARRKPGLAKGALGDLARWQRALSDFAVVSHLNVLLFDSGGSIVATPFIGNAIGHLLNNQSPGGAGFCAPPVLPAVRRCLRGKREVTVPWGPLTIKLMPIVSAGSALGVLALGWVCSWYPEPVGADRFAKEVGVSFADAWQAVRQVPPVPEVRLAKNANLLALMAELLVERSAETGDKEEKLRSLTEKYQALQREVHSKDQLLAVISHELRTPLTPMLSWLPEVREHLLNGQVSEALHGLEVIERNARQLAHLIDEMLDLSRLRMQRISLAPEVISPSLIVNETVASTMGFIRGRSLEIASECQEDLPAVFADKRRLLQCLANLVSNAVKFTPDTGRITVRAARRGEHVEFSVEDTGLGMDSAAVDLVFDRFMQAHGEDSRRRGGLGIGLSIVKELVELQGGHVTAYSAGPGRGSTFSVLLPAAATQPVTPPKTTVPKTTGPKTTAPKTIQAAAPLNADTKESTSRHSTRLLLVDDSQDTLDVMSVILRRVGYDVKTADSAAAAMEVVATNPPEVFITDVGLQDCDGIELVRRLRSAGNTAMRTIAVTGYLDEGVRARAAESGIDVYLTKPFRKADLLDAVARLAKPRQTAAVDEP